MERVSLIKSYEGRKLSWRPSWKGVLENYSKKTCSHHLWRVEHLGFEFEDLLQEAWIVYRTCREKYHYVTEPQHFMSLFMTSLSNRITDLSNKSAAEADTFSEIELSETDHWGQIEQEAELRLRMSRLQDASEEVRKVINLIFRAPEALLKSIGFGQGVKRGDPTLTNRQLCSLLGYDSNQIDLVRLTKDYIIGK